VILFLIRKIIQLARESHPRASVCGDGDGATPVFGAAFGGEVVAACWQAEVGASAGAAVRRAAAVILRDGSCTSGERYGNTTTA